MLNFLFWKVGIIVVVLFWGIVLVILNMFFDGFFGIELKEFLDLINIVVMVVYE